MPLSEAAAWALLEQHCSLLCGAVWIWSGLSVHCADWSHHNGDRVDLAVRAHSVAQGQPRNWRRAGARLRLALSVAHAVSCCPGFEPATHQRFWRRVVETLWLPPRLSQPAYAFAFSPTAFAHVGVNWGAYLPDDCSFWLGFFRGTALCDVALESVLTTLAPHLPRRAAATRVSLPPLRVSLLGCLTGPPSDEPDDDVHLNRIIAYEHGIAFDSLRILLRVLPLTQSVRPPCALRLDCMVAFRVGEDAVGMRDTLERLARAATAAPHLQLTISQLSIQLAPHVAPRSAEPTAANRRALVARSRALGALLRMLLLCRGDDADADDETPTAAFRVHRVAVFGCNYSDYRLVGAALSAVALAVPPVDRMHCSGLVHASRPSHHLLQLAWLAFTLHRRRGRRPHVSSAAAAVTAPPLALSLDSHGVAISERESRYITQLVARGTPLRDVVGESLRLRFGGHDDAVARLTVVCPRDGSAVRLATGTRLYVEPMRTTDVFVVVTLALEELVDLVAHVADKGGFVGVVYAGYGLVWAEACCVMAWHWVDDDVVMTEEEDDDDKTNDDDRDNPTRPVLASLALENRIDKIHMPFEQPPFDLRLTAMLRLTASATLRTVAIDRVVVTRDDLTQLLVSAPRLDTLALTRCVIESLAPLADAYTNGNASSTWSVPRAARVALLSLNGSRDPSKRDVVLPPDPRYDFSARSPGPYLYENERGDGDDTGGRAAQWIAPLLDLLARGNAHGVLRELHVDLIGMRAADVEAVALPRLVHALTSTTRSLTRLHVACRFDTVAACATHLAPLQDVALPDPPRGRRAVLSVLRAFACAIPEVARPVLALGEGNVVRTVTWVGC